MGRLIAFDRQTAEMISAEQANSGNALDAALNASAPSAAVVRAAGGETFFVEVRNTATQQSPAPQPVTLQPHDANEPVAYEPTGFLGVHDSPLYAEDLLPRKRKTFWQKVVDVLKARND